ncbi:hypothetical protein BC828DRAFT_380328 [Blastocladiella britannica]|nr:hypothetical protein BC828DRAFT_380328 [Blastocladiella britannica]
MQHHNHLHHRVSPLPSPPMPYADTSLDRLQPPPNSPELTPGSCFNRSTAPPAFSDVLSLLFSLGSSAIPASTATVDAALASSPPAATRCEPLPPSPSLMMHDMRLGGVSAASGAAPSPSPSADSLSRAAEPPGNTDDVWAVPPGTYMVSVLLSAPRPQHPSWRPASPPLSPLVPLDGLRQHHPSNEDIGDVVEPEPAPRGPANANARGRPSCGRRATTTARRGSAFGRASIPFSSSSSSTLSSITSTTSTSSPTAGKRRSGSASSLSGADRARHDARVRAAVATLATRLGDMNM